MRIFASPILPACGVVLLAAIGCKEENAGRGTAPDKTAVPPSPMVATSAGPVSSVPAANLAGTVPRGVPIHDGATACSVQIGNAVPAGREYSVFNAGNVDLSECTAAVYAYDPSGKQLARIEITPVGAKGVPRTLAPKEQVRGVLPLPDAIAKDPRDHLEPIVTHARFGDGVAWDAPDRAPAQKAPGQTPHAEPRPVAP